MKAMKKPTAASTKTMKKKRDGELGGRKISPVVRESKDGGVWMKVGEIMEDIDPDGGLWFKVGY